MDNPMETLRLTLLVTLLALLAYILYKKLLTRLQKGNLTQSYIEFDDPKNSGAGVFQIGITFPQKEKVTIKVIGPDGQILSTLIDEIVQVGEQVYDLKLDAGSGKHTLALKTDRQSTQCFIVA
jgi:hypothetical protein